MKLLRTLIVATAAAALTLPPAAALAASAKKNARDKMSEKQKADLRKKAREWCKKNYANGGGAYIVRVEIMQDGRVRCWYKS